MTFTTDIRKGLTKNKVNVNGHVPMQAAPVTVQRTIKSFQKQEAIFTGDIATICQVLWQNIASKFISGKSNKL